MQYVVRLDDAALSHFTGDLSAMADRALDAEPAMERIADDFLDVERALFASDGGLDGGWAPDSPDWLARKASLGKSTRTNVYTGALLESLTVRHAKFGLRVTGPGEVVVGTLDPVANLLQYSHEKTRFAKTRNGKPLSKPKSAGVLPTRRLVEINPAVETRWSGFVEGWLTDGLKGIGTGL